MKIELLKINGIGPFTHEIELNFSQLESIVSINGPNGVGKTFLLECVPGALFNYWPFRMAGQKISVYDFITPNANAYIEMIFTCSGRKYRIVRNYTLEGTWTGNTFKEKHKNQTAFMYEYDAVGKADPWTPVAKDVNTTLAYVEENVCTRQLFLASVFNSQNSAGDLVEIGVKERKEVFASLIGMDHLQETSNLFKSRVDAVKMMIDKHRIELKIHESGIVNLDELQTQEAAAKAMLQSLEDESIVFKATRQDMMQRVGAQMEAVKRYQEIDREIMECVEEKTRLADRKCKLDENIGAEGKVDNGIIRAEELRLELMGRNRIDYSEAYEEINERLKKLKEFDEEIQKIKDETNREKTKNNEERGEKRNQLQAEKSALFTVLEYKKEVGFVDDLTCSKDCKFIDGLKDKLKYLKVTKEEEVRKEIEHLEKEIDYFTTQNEILEKQKEEKIKEFEPSIEDVKASIRLHEARIQDFKNYDQHTKAIESQYAAIGHERLKATKESIQQFKSERINVMEKIEKIQEKKVRLEDSLKKIKDEVNSADAQKTLLETVKKQIEELQQKKQSCINSLGLIEEKRKNSKLAEMKSKFADRRIKSLEKLQMNYSVLQEAFSLNGVQALLIDAEKYTFLSIAKELFSILSGGKIALQFETSKTLKGGGSKEDFGLYLIVEGKKRELSQCSQGQQDLGRIVMRATLGIYNAQKTSGKLETYFLDETTGSLDEMNREAYLAFLKHLLQYFRQIIVITHQDISRSIPCRVEIDEKRTLRMV